MELVAIIGVLVLVITIQQVFYLRQINKLLDKLMSRSYTEYIKASDKPKFEVRAPVMEEPEDLRTLQGINL